MIDVATKRGIFLLEIGIAAVFTSLGAMLVLMWVVTPADQAGQPVLQAALQSVSSPLTTPASTTSDLEGGLISETGSRGAWSSDWPPRFIVRFEPNSDIARTLRQFREDRRGARRRFYELAYDHAAINGFHLEGITASGDAVLSYRAYIGNLIDAELHDQLIMQLNASTDVSFVTPFQAPQSAS